MSSYASRHGHRPIGRWLGLALLVATGLLLSAGLPGASAATDRYVAPGGEDTGDCSDEQAPCATIQYAIDQAAAGDTIYIADGTYVINTQLTVWKTVSLQGESQAGTILNFDGHTGYGIFADQDGTEFHDFTVNGPNCANPPPASCGSSAWGFKIQGTVPNTRVSGIVLDHITVFGSGRSGIDLNGVSNATLSNITVSDNGLNGGVGLAITDSDNIAVSNIVSENNPWGQVGIWTGTHFNGGVDGITFSGTNVFTAAANGVLLYTEREASPTDSIENISAPDFDFTVSTSQPAAFDTYQWYQPDLATAIAFAEGINTAAGVTTAVVRAIADGAFYVGGTLSIQAAIDAAPTDGTVNVEPGTYLEDVVVNKEGLDLLGAGIDQSVIVGQKGGPPDTVALSAPDVVVDGFTVTREGNSVAEWNDPELNNQGVAMLAQGGTLRNSKVYGNRNGVYVFHAPDSVIENNEIVLNRTGIHLHDAMTSEGVDGLVIRNNTINNNTTIGILLGDFSPFGDENTADVTIEYNDISGNWYSQLEYRWKVGGTILAEKNWFGPGIVTISEGVPTGGSPSTNSGEPGYADQIPAAFGGTATPPGGSLPYVRWNHIDNPTNPVDVEPWLCSGVDTQPTTPGFQPLPGLCPPASPPDAEPGDFTSSATELLNADSPSMELAVAGGPITATYSGDSQIWVFLGLYDEDPTAGGAGGFQVGDNYLDVYAVGSDDPDATLTVTLPCAINDVLRYWDGAAWAQVRTNGGGTVTCAGGTMTVVFGPSSVPTLQQLSGTPIVSGDPPAIEIQIEAGPVFVGDEVTVEVVASAADLQGVDIELLYNPAELELDSAGDIVLGGPQLTADSVATNVFNDTSGTIHFAFAKTGFSVSGNDILVATITFTAVGPGPTVDIDVMDATLADGDGFAMVPLTVLDSDSIVILAQAAISGTVTLQGRTNHSGVTVRVDSPPLTQLGSALTAANGSFTLSIPFQGDATRYALMPGYLRASSTIELVPGGNAFAPIQLKGGDANGDATIDIADLSLIAAEYGTPPDTLTNGSAAPPQQQTADINGDALVDILDLSVAAANYQVTGPSVWP